MWWPRSDRPYNETLSPVVTVALGREITAGAVADGRKRKGLPGLVRARYSDVDTIQLLIRPKLEKRPTRTAGERKTVVQAPVQERLRWG